MRSIVADKVLMHRRAEAVNDYLQRARPEFARGQL